MPPKSKSRSAPGRTKSTAKPPARAPKGKAKTGAARPGGKSAKPAGKGGSKPTAKRGQGRIDRIEARPAIGGAGEAANRSGRETARSLETAKAAIDAALDKKALLPVLIDVSKLASYTDFIGIVSGRSDRHVDAIADGVLQAMKARGRSLLGQEGSGSGRWTLLDFGDVVIHVFYHPVREFYDLESLWVDAPRLPLKIPPEAMISQPDALYGNL